MKKYRISGVPITEDGSKEGRLVGILTNRDLRFETNVDRPIAEVMTHENLDHSARGHHAGCGAGNPPRAQSRKTAGRRSRFPAQGADHRQGHSEGRQVSERVKRHAWPAALRRGGRGGARTPSSARRHSSAPTSTFWSSTRHTVIRRTCWTWCATCAAASRRWISLRVM